MAWWKRSRANNQRRALTSAAASLSADIEGRASARVDRPVDWQEKAWGYYDEIGELRFAVGWIANAMSRVNLVAALPPRYQGDEPTPIDLQHLPQYRRYVEIVAEIGGGPAGQAQLLASLARQLTVPGVGFLHVAADIENDTLGDWRILSQDQVRQQGGRIETMNATGGWVPLSESDILQKVWRPHPRRSDLPDSPVRALLGTLKEIKRLSERVIADAESRLAGNGLLVLPSEFEFTNGGKPNTRSESGGDPEDGDHGDDFNEAMIDTAALSIADQGTAAARVPLSITVPGEYADKVQHIKFWTEFDAHLVEMRDAAVKRFALGMDMPPEVVLGMGMANHWNAWQISEEMITLQIEPLAELSCDGLAGVYRAMCESEGLDPDAVILWYDTTDLTTRPDRSTSAAEAHSRLKLSDAAYLRELGLDVADLPTKDELRFRILMDVAKGAPTLAPAMLAAAGLLDPAVAIAATNADTSSNAPSGETPTTSDDTQPAQRSIPEQSNAALLAAADMLVVRALELAGRRLRGAAGKGKPGGAESIECDDPTLLHTMLPATSHASLETLLASAWDRVPPIAERLAVDEPTVTAWLDGYTRSLIACGHAHTFERLASSYESVHRAVAAAR